MTSKPATVTILIFEDIIEKCGYIIQNFNADDLDSFESDQSLEKLDKVERVVEELHMEIAHFTERPFPVIAKTYQTIVEGILLFRENYNLDIIRSIGIHIQGLKEAYEGVIKKDEGNQ